MIRILFGYQQQQVTADAIIHKNIIMMLPYDFVKDHPNQILMQ